MDFTSEAANKACADPNPVIDGRMANCNLASLGRPQPPSPSGRLRPAAPYLGSPQGGPFGYSPPVPYNYQPQLPYSLYGICHTGLNTSSIMFRIIQTWASCNIILRCLAYRVPSTQMFSHLVKRALLMKAPAM